MGGTYEEWVIAWYLLHLLLGGPVAGLGRLTRVVTQTRAEGWLLDDIRLHLEDGGVERRVAIECKAGRFLSAAGLPERETVDRAWRMLCGMVERPFQERQDQMFLVIRDWSGEASRAWRSIERAAAGGGAGPVRRASLSATKEKILAGLGPPEALGLEGAAGDPARLLAHLRVVHLELGDRGDQHDDEAVRLCRDLVEAPTDARKLWDALGRLARGRQHAFELDQASLVEALRPDHALRILPDHRRVLADIHKWRAEDFPIRPAHIAGVHIPRTEVIERLRNSVVDHPIVALTGASGVGKTGIVRDLRPGDLGVDKVLAMRAARLSGDRGSRIVQALRAHPAPRGVLVIDAIDRDPAGETPRRVAALVAGLGESESRWAVVLVCAEAAWATVWPRISQVANTVSPPPQVSVMGFQAEEVAQIVAPLGQRLGPPVQERLQAVLSNPWWLNRVVDLVQRVDFPSVGAMGPAMLGRLWWTHALEEVDPGGSARAQALVLAPSLADEGGEVHPSPAELRELIPMVEARVLERRDGAVQFSHARFEELALARHLLRIKSAGRLEEWRRRAVSIRWRPALVLAAAELVETELQGWLSLAATLDRQQPLDRDLLVVLLEALLHTGEPGAALDSVAGCLLDDSAARFRLLVGHLRHALAATRTPEAWERLGWRALVRWAASHASDLKGASSRALYPLVEGAGLYSRVLGLPRAELHGLAGLVVGRVDDALHHRGGTRLEDPELLAAFLAIADLDLERARPLLRMLCGRERRPAPPPMAPSRADGSRQPPAWLVYSGPEEDSPSVPWPDGPLEEPVRDFREVALSLHGAVGLVNADPILAVEVILALFIEAPETREPWSGDHFPPISLLPGFEGSARVDDGFFVPVEVLARDWRVLLAFALKLSAFAARALEAYRAEAGGPEDEPIRLDLPDGAREYPGGKKLWNIGRGVDRPDEVLAYTLKRLGVLILAAALQPDDREYVVGLLLRCPSTATLGLAGRLVAESPALIEGESGALLQDPRLSVWEFERDPGAHPGALVLAARDAWFRAGWSWEPIDSARAGWSASLEGDRCPTWLRGWTRNLVTWFDRTRWTEARLPEGRTSWVWEPDEEQQERNQDVAAMNAEVFGGLQVWFQARRLIQTATRLALSDARRMFEAARDLSEGGPQVVDARMTVACALTVLAPEALDDADVLAAVWDWLEPAFLPDDVRAGAGVVVGRLDAITAVAELWARDPASPVSRRLAGLAITCQDGVVVRTFFDAAARHRPRLPGELRRLLRAGFAWRAGQPNEEDAAREAAVDALVNDPGLPPTDPAAPFPTSPPDWLAPMTRWVRTVARDREVDAIVHGMDACLRAELARRLAAERDREARRGVRPASPSRSGENSPSQYEIELLRTLGGWLLDLPRRQADEVVAPWLNASTIPPDWLAWLVDGIYKEALARPLAHLPTSSFLDHVVGRILDDQGWRRDDGTLRRELQDRTLGVGYSGYGAGSWKAEAAPLLRDLRELRSRWVERVCASGFCIPWLADLGRATAASGARIEFAELLVRFPLEVRRREPQAQHIAAFLQCLVTDASFQRPCAAAEALLADIRAAGLAQAWRIEESIRGVAEV